jgi:hypothetical protein
LSAYALQARVHQPGSFIAQHLYQAHNDPTRHWARDHGLPRYKREASALTDLFDVLLIGDGSYKDTHAWQFTPSSFYQTTFLLFNMGLTGLVPERVYHTPNGR